MMRMLLSRCTRGNKLSCCLPLNNNFAALYHTRESLPDEAAARRKVFDEMLQSCPLPPLVRFNQLLGRLFESELYSEVISFNRQMVLHGIDRDQYTLSTLISSYCHVKQLGLGLSVLGNIFKMGLQVDGIALDSLIHAFVHEESVDEAAETFDKFLEYGHCESIDAAYRTLTRYLLEDMGPLESVTQQVVTQQVQAKPKSVMDDDFWSDYFANPDKYKFPESFSHSDLREILIDCERIFSGRSPRSSSTKSSQDSSSSTTLESSQDSSSSITLTTLESSQDSFSSPTLESSRDSSEKGSKI